jgi:glutamine amidotransferase
MAADIVIVDYGMGNLRSVQKAFEAVGAAADISADPHRVSDATKLVLPGVGAFRDAIAKLRESGLAESVIHHIHDGLPFLGICLGYQMLFTRSTEDGVYAGLDLFPGEVVRFDRRSGLKVPHMGWNTLRLTRPDCPLFAGLPPEPAFYFVHSYYPTVVDATLTAAEADYPDPFSAAVWRGNVFGTQFHPEKSQAVGQVLLKNFANL